MTKWLLYGANGHTGELIAREARKRGLEPVLAGRNLTAVKLLAEDLGAGPFSVTAPLMIDACVRTSTHYLDITGEMDVFAYARETDGQARAASATAPNPRSPSPPPTSTASTTAPRSPTSRCTSRCPPR
ncbi:hypothetical protein [Actinomadura sp. NPDC048394]|uniref:hypothetical protein n=1 Tax=Actinomadura sp. NPDC048394 TaxID=3158223 RepID=UPI0034010CC0